MSEGGKKPLRSIRVDEALWRAAQRVAADRRESLNAAIVRFLERYVDEHPDSE